MDYKDKVMGKIKEIKKQIEEKYAYWYDKKTGEYKGLRRRQYKCGEYLMPGNCTLIKPPEEKKGKVIYWNGKGWEHVDDCRGKTFYKKSNPVDNKKSQEIKFLDLEYTDKKPPEYTEFQNIKFENDDWIIEEKPQSEKNEITKQKKYNKIRILLLDKIIDDALESPDANNPIKIWINDIYKESL
jgi:hypothetical protein